MVVVVVFGEKGELDSNLGLSVGRRVIYTRRPFFYYVTNRRCVIYRIQSSKRGFPFVLFSSLLLEILRRDGNFTRTKMCPRYEH